MKYFLVNPHLSQKIKNTLADFGEVISLPAFEKLPFPVNAHPDMLMADIDGTIFVHREYTAGQDLLKERNIPFQISEQAVSATYPDDVALNCFAAKNALFAKLSSVSLAVKNYAQKRGFSLRDVKQGYAKCSSTVIGDVVITADKGIFHAAKANGLETLLIPPYSIGIEVYDTGFIGGASGVIAEKTIGFFGDIDVFPAGKQIRSFLEERGFCVISLGEGELFDYGGLICVNHHA